MGRDDLMIIIALDPPPEENLDIWIQDRYENLKDLVYGFKIGLPAIIKHGTEHLAKHFKNYEGLLIADLKLADIGDIMSMVTKVLRLAGFNAIIAHSFTGYRQGLDILARTCRDLDLKLISVVSMSHEGSKEFIDKHLDEFIELAKLVGSWGVVAPATRPEIVRYIRSKIGSSIKILSPGIGMQGAKPGDGLCAGADFEIIGRSITHAHNVREMALNTIYEQKRRLALCRG